MSNPKRKTRQYDPEFISNAVNLYKNSRKSLKALSQELGIPPGTLSTWIKKSNLSEASLSDSEQAEFKRLKRELSIVKEERDILKKALAIFSLEKKKH